MRGDLAKGPSEAESAGRRRPRKGARRRWTATDSDGPVLITGGAGFIGTNLASRLAAQGRQVLIFDNLSRGGASENLQWLRRRFGERIEIETADIRDADAVNRAVARSRQVFHLAAQVAVTTSLIRPQEDFAVNAQGTLHLLEALRNTASPPPLVFTSTNKVYGRLGEGILDEGDRSYRPACPTTASRGICEQQPLDFYSPYGCSKGTADQYVRDYARIYGIPATVFRMSCIYGPHQRGTEDQGWVAHFMIRALRNETITLFGNGKQVRDILFVDDLMEAFLLAQEHMPALTGRIFNIGGGPSNAVSLLELLDRLKELEGTPPPVSFGPWRPGDQPYYVSDTSAFAACTGWRPKTGMEEGLGILYRWLRENHRPTDAPQHAECIAL